jgi:hypothetical protein
MGNGALAIGPKLPRPSSTLPTLPTSAVRKVVDSLGYTGRGLSVVAKAARDPKRPRAEATVIYSPRRAFRAISFCQFRSIGRPRYTNCLT